MAELPELEQLYKTYRTELYRYLCFLCRDPHRAEDLLSDTFLRAIQCAPAWQGGAVKAWLFGLARNIWREDLRRRRQALPFDDALGLTAGDTLAWSFNTMPLTLSVQAVTQRPEYAGQAGSAWQLTLYTSAGAAQAVFDRWYAERGGDPAASCRRNYTLAYETDAPAALLAELTDTVAAAGTEGGRLSAYPVNNAAEAAAYRSMLLVLRILAYGFVALIALLGTANIANTVSTGLTLRGRELAMLRSVGMEPADLRRMVLLQSLLYALQALAWGLPLAFVCLLAEYRLLRTAWAFSFTLPWAAILAVAAGLTGLTLLAALPALRLLDRRGILTGLRQEE